MRVELRGAGKLVPNRVHWVTAPVGGVVVERPLEAGMAVTGDGVVLRLSNPDLELEVLNARSSLRAAESDLATRRAQAATQLLDIDATIEQLESDVGVARMRMSANEQLYEKELLAELDLDVSRENLRAPVAKLESQRRRRAGIAEAQEAELVALRGRVEQAEALLAHKEDRLASLEVRAGMDGVLEEYGAGTGVGMRVSPGEMLARVSDPKDMKAVVELPESQVREARTGLPAVLEVMQAEVRAEVARIDPAVRDGLVTVDVLPVEPLPQGARPEQSLTCTIRVRELHGVVYVRRPVYSVANQPGMLFKVVNEEGVAEQTAVVYGTASASAIEIDDGLSPGDTVVVSDTRRLEDHTRIQLTR